MQPVHGSDEEALEATPLLFPSAEAHNGPTKAFPPRHTRCTWRWEYVVAHCIVVAVTADIGEYLFLAPKVRLFESIICTDYYLREDPSLVGGDGFVPEHFCKVDSVQDSVATILGWQLFFDSIPSILLPIPYGYLADTYGRKWIMVLSMLGYVLSWASTLFIVGVLHLPLQYVWLSSIFFLVGGGPPMGTTLITTIVADVAPPEKRSSAFFYRFTSDLIAECFVPPITAILMSKSPWVPLLTALVLLTFSTTITLALPETLPVQDSGEFSHTQPAAGSSEPDEEPTPGKDLDKHDKWKDWIHQTRESFAFVSRDASVAALVFTFLISKVGRQSFNLLLLYVSKRYDWSISQAGLLLSLRAGVNILLFTIVLPFVTTFAFFKTGATSKDLWIARTSIILMIFGAFILSASVTPALMIIGLILYTLGTGFPLVIRSLVTTLVETHHESKTSDIGRLYALILLMEGIGNLVAGPGMARVFRLGILLGKPWLGLPFAFAAVLFALISPIVFMVKA